MPDTAVAAAAAEAAEAEAAARTTAAAAAAGAPGCKFLRYSNQCCCRSIHTSLLFGSPYREQTTCRYNLQESFIQDFRSTFVQRPSVCTIFRSISTRGKQNVSFFNTLFVHCQRSPPLPKPRECFLGSPSLAAPESSHKSQAIAHTPKDIGATLRSWHALWPSNRILSPCVYLLSSVPGIRRL